MPKTYLAIIVALFEFVFLQQRVSAQTNDSVVNFEADVAGLSLTSPDTLPSGGTFWVVTPPGNGDNGVLPPYPCMPSGISVGSIYTLPNGSFLVDATAGNDGNSQQLAAQMNAVSNVIELSSAPVVSHAMRMRAQALSGPPSFDDTNDDDSGTNYLPTAVNFTSINTNLLWLEITNVANQVAYLNLHNGTNQVYGIYATPDLTQPFTNWLPVQEVWPTNATTNILPFTVIANNQTNTFYRAMDWTSYSVNGLPAWWTFEWFGNLNESVSNLDSSGNTLGYDYTNNINPNPDPISFSMELGSNCYFNATPASGEFVLISGTPSFEAVLINDTNFADAIWQPYDGIVHMNLGPTDGVYQVSVGLRGFAADDVPTWVNANVYLDRKPPTLGINLANHVVATPYIQLSGWGDESLSGVSYDISNALEVLTNQSGQVMGGQFFDTNIFEYTTNNFTCVDVLLTNGLNSITVHAVDMAGNVTITNFNVTLDYSVATNPIIQMAWPQNGGGICGSSFTVRGWTEDSAATIMAQITDSIGDTNMVTGSVERSGKLWAPNLPLNTGTNWVTLWVTNSAGLSSMTNFSVIKSSVSLWVNSINGDLWQPTTTLLGYVSDTNASIWVNGVQGINDGTGYWEADNVPVSSGGVASFDISTAPTGSPGSELSIDQNKPTEVVIDSAHWHIYRAYWDFTYFTFDDEQWDYTVAGGGTLHQVFTEGYPSSYSISTTDIKYNSSCSSLGGQDAFNYINMPWFTNTTTQISAGSGLTMTLPEKEGIFNPIDSTDTYKVQTVLHVGGLAIAGDESTLQEIEVLFPTDQNGQSIPPNQVTVIGQMAIGNVTAQLVDGAVVTPQAGAPGYSFQESGGQDNLTISVSSSMTNANLATVVPEFCVGQRVIFLPNNNFSYLTTNVAYSWAFTGDYVNESSQASSSASVNYDKNLLLLNTPLQTNWWADGGLKQAQLRETLTLPNGHTQSVTAKGQFMMYRPTFSAFHNDENDFSDFPIWSYAIPYLKGNMTWDVTLNSRYDGLFGVTQLLNSDISPYNTGDEDWLDGSSIIYGTITNGPDAYEVTNITKHFTTLDDHPQAVASPCVTMKVNFKDYLRFQPVGYNSIYVTIATNGWYMDGAACLVGGVSSSNLPPASPCVDSDKFPYWTSIRPGG